MSSPFILSKAEEKHRLRFLINVFCFFSDGCLKGLTFYTIFCWPNYISPLQESLTFRLNESHVLQGTEISYLKKGKKECREPLLCLGAAKVNDALIQSEHMMSFSDMAIKRCLQPCPSSGRPPSKSTFYDRRQYLGVVEEFSLPFQKQHNSHFMSSHKLLYSSASGLCLTMNSIFKNNSA